MAKKSGKKNPLYVLFMLLLTLTIVLTVAVVALFLKLRTANAKIAELQLGSHTQIEDEISSDDGSLPGDDTAATDGTYPAEENGTEQTQGDTQSSNTVGWLDLSGHNEVSVKPSSVFDEYHTYYTSEGVNLRSGPGTDYTKIRLLELGTEVRSAAKEGGWDFVNVNGKFGWIKSDYLSLTKPEVKTEGKSPAAQSQPTESSETPAEAGEVSEEIPAWLKTE